MMLTTIRIRLGGGALYAHIVWIMMMQLLHEITDAIDTNADAERGQCLVQHQQ